MSKFMTRQRRLLLNYLIGHADEPVSAKELAEELGADKMSLSAVYRNLAELEAEGKLRRCGADGSRVAYYRYIGGEECRDAIHLSCKSCGRTFHMNPSEADRLADSVKKLDGFELDKGDTVLHGICADCRGRGDENAADNL